MAIAYPPGIDYKPQQCIGQPVGAVPMLASLDILAFEDVSEKEDRR